MDGWVTIGTKLDTKELEKQLKEAESELKKFQKKEEELLNKKGKIKVNIDEYKKEEEEYNKLIEKSNEYKNKIEDLKIARKSFSNNGMINSENYPQYENLTNQINQAKSEQNELNTEIDKQYNKISKMEEKYSNSLNEIKQIDRQLQENTINQENINSKIDEYNQKLSNTNNIKNITKELNNTSNKMNTVIKQVARWTIALFSVRTLYGIISRASSTLSQYNSQYSTDLQYIQYVLAQAIKPILESIIGLIYKMLSYINYISVAWFGVNLFANASAESFKNASDSLSSASDNAKDLKKQLAGFDEMNVLSDTSSSSSSSSNASLPSVDLSNIQTIQGEIPSWLQWIVDNKDTILAVLGGMAGYTISIGSGLSFIKSLGIGLLITGVILAIQELIEFMNDPTFENFGGVIEGIGLALLGLSAIIGSVPLAIAAAIAIIVGLITQNWEDIKAFLQKGFDWLGEKSEWVHETFGDTIGRVYDTFVENLQLILNYFDTTFGNIKTIFYNIIDFIKNIFKRDWEGAWENIKTIFSTIWDQIKETAKTIFSIIWNHIKDWVTSVGDTISEMFKSAVNGVLSAIENILNGPINAINGLIDVINAVPRN